MPSARAPAPAPRSASSCRQPSRRRSRETMATLLVVEDEPHIASGLRFNLEAEGHAVETVDTGKAALEILRLRPASVDCMVLDVMLPDVDGYAVAAAARAQGWFTPILMLTARGR